MADVTYYVALPFRASDDGVVAGEPAECQSASGAIKRAEALARLAENAGAVAFSRTGDPLIGEFQDAVLIKAFGEVPSEFAGF